MALRALLELGAGQPPGMRARGRRQEERSGSGSCGGWMGARQNAMDFRERAGAGTPQTSAHVAGSEERVPGERRSCLLDCPL